MMNMSNYDYSIDSVMIMTLVRSNLFSECSTISIANNFLQAHGALLACANDLSPRQMVRDRLVGITVIAENLKLSAGGYFGGNFPFIVASNYVNNIWTLHVICINIVL